MLKKTYCSFIFFILLSPLVFSQAGSLDATFGTAGKVITTYPPINNYLEIIRSVAMQADGKIIAAGSSSGGITMVRYLADGSIDLAFGAGGLVAYSAPFTGVNYGLSVVIQTDGKIVVSGSCTVSNKSFVIVRFDSTGTVDNTFGLGGYTVTDFMNNEDTPFSSLLQPDGKLVVAGIAHNGTNKDVALARYINGFLDASFGNGGMVSTDFGLDETAYGVALQPDGKIVISGVKADLTTQDFILARYDTNGTLDNTFGIAGVVTTDFAGTREGSQAVAVKPNGKIVAGGWSYTLSDFALVQYNSNGAIDSTFGTNGIVTTEIVSTDAAMCLSLQNDGKIILGGDGGNGANYKFVLTRYNPDGSLDNTFGTGGKVATSFGIGYNAKIYSTVLQPDGRIVAGGSRELTNDYDFALARYSACTGFFKVEPDTMPLHWLVQNLATGVQPINYTWSWGDGDTSTGAYPSHIYAAPGYYNICLTTTDSTGCTTTYCDSSTYLNRNTTGNAMVYIQAVPPLTTAIVTVSPPVLTHPFIAYPNPAGNMVNVKFNHGIGTGDIYVVDVLGKVVLSAHINDASQKQINISNVASGIYTIKFVTANGTSSQRMAIQR